MSVQCLLTFLHFYWCQNSFKFNLNFSSTLTMVVSGEQDMVWKHQSCCWCVLLVNCGVVLQQKTVQKNCGWLFSVGLHLASNFDWNVWTPSYSRAPYPLLIMNLTCWHAAHLHCCFRGLVTSLVFQIQHNICLLSLNLCDRQMFNVFTRKLRLWYICYTVLCYSRR